MPPKKHKIKQKLSTNANIIKSRKCINNINNNQLAIYKAKDALRKAI